ncbi:MAG: biopolymer transporter ExbD [Planctomycetota bacterium]
MRAPNGAKRRGCDRSATDLTPMIDVVFLLIIFFLVSSHLARRETRLALDLPKATTGQPDDDPSPRLTINVAADGQLLLGALPLEPRQLAESLDEAQARQDDPLRVRLRGDERAPYAAIEPALAACAAAGVDDISLAVFAEATP